MDKKAITILRNSLGWFLERECMQKQLPTPTSLEHKRHTDCRAGLISAAHFQATYTHVLSSSHVPAPLTVGLEHVTNL